MPWYWRRKRGGTGGDTAELSLRLRRAAESLGPTFIKLGQIISSGEGLFPPELVDEFKRCRDQVPAEPFEAVRATVEADLGRPLDDVFAASTWSRSPQRRSPRSTPPACSRARTWSSRCDARMSPASCTTTCERWPGWRRTSSGASLSPHWPTRRARRAVRRHHRRGARLPRRGREHARRRRDAARARPDRLRVPRPHPALVTRRVLVMQRLDGFKFDDVSGCARPASTPGGRAHGDDRPDGRAMISGSSTGSCTRQPACSPTGAPRCSTSASSGARRRSPGPFLRLMMAGTMNDLKGRMAALPDLARCPPTPTCGRHPRPRTGPGADRPDEADRRPVGQGGPAGREGTARVRGADAQGADAVRRTSCSWTQRSPAGPRPRHPRRDRRHLGAPTRHGERLGRDLGFDSTSRRSTWMASRPVSASTPVSSVSPTANCRPPAP